MFRTAENRVRPYSTVDIGAAQATGAVSAAATWDGIINGKNRSALTELTITVSGKAVAVGETLNISGTTSYNGLHPIIKVIDATTVVIDVDFVADESGTWNMRGAKGFFIGFSVEDALLLGTNITSVVFFDDSVNQGDITAHDYVAGKDYFFGGIITEITLGAGGNMKLYRYSNNNPQK